MGIKLSKPKKSLVLQDIERVDEVVIDAPKKEKKTAKKQENKLGPDKYQPEFPDSRIEADETKDINISVKRGGEFGLPRLDIRIFQHSDLYTGFTKAGFNVPIEVLPHLIETLQEVQESCERKRLLGTE